MLFIMTWIGTFSIFGAYILGSINAAIIVSKLLGKADPRTVGSGNPGTTNILRASGKKAAGIVLLIDIVKGWLPVWGMGFFLSIQDPLIMSCVFLAVILGHLYPIFFRFQGGKGVATVIGAAFGLTPLLGLAFIGTWLVVAGISKRSSLAAIISLVLLPVYAYAGLAVPYTPLCVGIAGLLLWRHRSNIMRLYRGEEALIGR